MKYLAQSEVPVSQAEAFAYHMRKGALERLLPPWTTLTLSSLPGLPTEEGACIPLKWHLGPISGNWILHRTDYQPPEQFCMEQVVGPFQSYTHRHRFLAQDAHSCQMVDEVAFETPFFKKQIQKQLAKYFSWRHQRIREDLKCILSHPHRPMRILLSGASGFIGLELKVFLQLAGHQVVPLVRSLTPPPGSVGWDPENGDFLQEAFEDFDAVIHLAGEGIASHRWTKNQKRRLFQSRCRDTWLLSTILSRALRPPHVVICASAIGYYGDRGNELLTEESGPGKGFLAELCQQWEKSLDPIKSRGVRVVHARLGVVLGRRGGMLKKLLLPFQLGLGGKMGSGRQYMSWIGIDDLVGGLYHLLMTESLSGPFNLVAPEAVTQGEFAKTLAKQLHRPAFFHVPAWVIRCLLGEMGEELILASARVIPKRLLDSGYLFRNPALSQAI
ncbi:MAG: TIGR01777 family oxidoreductase [Verrucomicrobia bacterium]|nr:TIGR01777 family oxidoreductase [Verrucomicrobiota bacterium]